MARPSQTAAAPRPAGTVHSVLGGDLTVTGNVISKGEVQIDGMIQGDVHCATLIVGETAQITGGVVAEDIIVRGRVMGSVRGTRVTLQGNSHVEGDIYHQSLAIEQGAYFEGKSRRGEQPAPTATATAQAPPMPAAPRPQPGAPKPRAAE